MQASDILTVGVFHDFCKTMIGHLQAVRDAVPTVGNDLPRLLSIEQVMEECKVSRSTVWRWMKTGKPGCNGGTITLQHYCFSENEKRIPWPALAAFGQGLDFDLASLNGPTSLPQMRAVS